MQQYGEKSKPFLTKGLSYCVCYDPTCLAWQAYPIALGRQCFHYCNRSIKRSNVALKPKSQWIAWRKTQYNSRILHFVQTTFLHQIPLKISIEIGVSLIFRTTLSRRELISRTITNFKQGYLPRVRLLFVYSLKHRLTHPSLLECELVQKTFHSTRGMGSRWRRDFPPIRRGVSSLHRVFERRVLAATR